MYAISTTRVSERHIKLEKYNRRSSYMIGRLWRGWTTVENADTYERLLRQHVLPGIHRVDGYQGAYLLRQDGKDEVEFVTVTFFESLDAVRAFAGTDYTRAVVPAEARQLLIRFDETSLHYQVIMTPQ
jgi:heme-degrading monooxygenase HmoA